jgi:hypothetical protein
MSTVRRLQIEQLHAQASTGSSSIVMRIAPQ